MVRLRPKVQDHGGSRLKPRPAKNGLEPISRSRSVLIPHNPDSVPQKFDANCR